LRLQDDPARAPRRRSCTATGAQRLPGSIAAFRHPQIHAVARRQVDARRAVHAHEPVEDDVE